MLLTRWLISDLCVALYITLVSVCWALQANPGALLVWAVEAAACDTDKLPGINPTHTHTYPMLMHLLTLLPSKGQRWPSRLPLCEVCAVPGANGSPLQPDSDWLCSSS